MGREEPRHRLFLPGDGRDVDEPPRQLHRVHRAVPAARGPSFLKLTEKREKIGAKAKNSQVLTVHTDADAQRAVATVGELPELEGLVDWRPTGGPLPLDRHLFYVAEAKLLAVLPSSRDKLILRRVEVQ